MRLRLLGLLTVLIARPSAAAAPLELADAIAREVAQREHLATETRRLQGEAVTLAERVAALKAGGGTARAEGELSRRLREFDRLVQRLERLEGEIAETDRRITRRRREFEAAAEAEERRLQERARREGAAAVAASLHTLQTRRSEIAAGTAVAAFRPPLEITIDPLDGPAELEAKLALIDGEHTRVDARLADLRAEEVLLAARLETKREWARQLASARRDAAGELELLERGYEDAERRLRELGARAEALAAERRSLDAARGRLKTRRSEAEARLGELRKGR